MNFTRLVMAAVMLGSVGTGALQAQTQPGSEPAEFPPASYQGKQYVDSNGCVFIRAGIDGNVSWVPRVTRSRSGVCGFRPTFAGQVTSPEPVQTAQTAAVEQITNPAPVSNPAPVAAPKPRPVRAASKPKPAPVVRQKARAPAPKPVVVAKAPAPIVEVAAAPVAVDTACTNLSPMGQRYTRNTGAAVRCGPQAQPIVGARIAYATPSATAVAPARRTAKATAEPQPIRVSPHTRIVPRHVAVNRTNTTNVTVPHGYKRVWTDGRLNPHRAEQTLAGHAAMSLIWTSTVPRRLINQADGHDVTASVALVYPYTDFARQQRELGQVTIVKRNGQTLKRIVRNTSRVVSPEPRQARVKTVSRTPTYSSRSTPEGSSAVTPKRAQSKAEVAGKGFVQVGKFADPAAAQRQAQQVQRLGLPVRIGRYTRNGRTTRLVIAGPFGGQRDVSRAVSRLRSAGFSGAFAR
ncbi:SPOR domain-containing protein [uncultured Sulfitobacter sp.]|uniref:SPOR domain-containing protein n=1 Tax=uncultured Sulfitobacter sp. TaxID=191468 RepID=UPI002633171B|nr:SPOR domain-containing protein [uncultured Sulfitobacter sp.]